MDVLQISAFKGRPRSHRSLTQDTARTRNISVYPASPEGEDSMHVCALEEGDKWMTPYRRYIADGILPAEPEEGKKIKRNSARYTLVDGALFRHRFTNPILTCVSGDECTRLMSELHEGICGSHVRGMSIYSPWPFHTWGIDILGPFPLAIRQMKYLIVAIEYFTKWIEVEPVAQITAHKVQHFVWKNIVCRFGVPRRLVSDNGTQFASQ